jgi:hypothetical protein
MKLKITAIKSMDTLLRVAHSPNIMPMILMLMYIDGHDGQATSHC